MNITLTDEEVRTAIVNYLEALHVTIPTKQNLVVEADAEGRVCAKIEGAQLLFAPEPKQAQSYQQEQQIAHEDLSDLVGPDGNLGAVIDSQRKAWGVNQSSTSLAALGKADPADFSDEIGDPWPLGRGR